MRTSYVIGLLVSALALSFSGWSAAQYGSAGSEGMMKMWNLKAGIFIPSGGGSLDTVANIGIEHEHPANEIIHGVPGNFTLSIDYAQFKTATMTGEKNVSFIPVFFNWKHHYPISGSNTRTWFWGVGIGEYFTSREIREMGMTSKSQFAWNAQLGYFINPSWFVEARYMASKHPEDSGILVLDAGYNF